MPRGESVSDPAEVHAPRKRMSLRALLHFLYERAGFNRWYPAMEGRRNQGVLHKYLSEAARGVLLKGAMLDERLYVPEPFRAEFKEQIGERRRKKLALLMSHEDAVQFKMAILTSTGARTVFLTGGVVLAFLMFPLLVGCEIGLNLVESMKRHLRQALGEKLVINSRQELSEMPRFKKEKEKKKEPPKPG